ncbi:MAG: bifunctional heptose 7-phosphate kinase/heptose 1-phosphate adenyltransferase, partial [Planctomycetes bacterium]|nr:bifunctional heptose 7-phosphate kinase/heptose 1-phosphate adenyltransferase [Planctomycetota bacterium]
ELLKELLAKSEINTNGLIKVSDRPTISKQRLIGLAQHRHRQQLLRIDDECTDALSEDVYEKVLGVYRSQLPDADVVCLQDYNKGLLSHEVCGEMIDLAVKAGKKVLIDPPMSGDYSKYSNATLITPNRRETSRAVGFDVNTIADAEKAAKMLAEKHSLEAAVVTLDKEGAYLWTTKGGEHIPTVPRSVYDVTGAGDMVLAMLAVAIAAGCDFKTAVQLSNIAGGIEAEKFGVATVTVDEIVNEIIAENKGKAGKIHEVDMLLNELSFHRQQKQTVVFTNGCFDVLHRGHIEYLKFCKEQGDIVVLGLNSDNSVTNIKGPERPINNQHDRAAVLAALETVDFITVFNEPDPLKLIKQVKPDV